MIFYFFLFVNHVRDPPIQPSSMGEGDFKRQKVVKENMKLNQNFQEVIWGGRGGGRLLKLKSFHKRVGIFPGTTHESRGIFPTSMSQSRLKYCFLKHADRHIYLQYLKPVILSFKSRSTPSQMLHVSLGFF